MIDWKTVRWPTVALLLGILTLAMLSPTLFFALVSEKVLDKIIALPWTSIITVGAPMLAAGVGVIRLAFARPILPKPPEPPAT